MTTLPPDLQQVGRQAAELLRAVHHAMSQLEGPDWTKGEGLDLSLLEDRRLIVELGLRSWTWCGEDEPGRLLETGVGRARVIEVATGRVVDETLLEPWQPR